MEFAQDGADLVGDISKYILDAQKEVLLSEYLITDLRVLQALATVHQRGTVRVAVLLESKPGAKVNEAPSFLRSQGIPVILAQRGNAGKGYHNQRYIVIDREAVIISSCDLTVSAQRNNENLLVLHNVPVAIRYFNEWIDEAGMGTPLK